MRRKLSPKQFELDEFIDKMMYEEWKPIPVDDLPQDEYKNYVSKFLNHGATKTCT